ncbi:FKBP-type peptidyl-prolyl cis-trans isomerase [Ponticaulis sp.]|uniref:FKBP-type peptidyl-prolyl cis-trans isomerase n=1 Tax=Ponticaulis sp. TaxID=2020902 RepID=UPI000B641F49|nr:FKBP-type peptidyl-prolyl cis-trans isomerase [Ponticaulis sp.]MAI90697.1 peptidylprolyl isomerase [Ponticaulis sp.]OUX99202.1 MAG: hypothetical protein CBB65_09675 [Hyphomonadaceae bacterium TMED5]|tara:strand:- start:13870 stop:14442 length:573 start_codon:yes stop_codon:yes gene_type:complete
MIRPILLALGATAALTLAACEPVGGNAGSAAERMPATPADDPSDPWATYVNDGWDHESDAVTKTDSGLEYIVLAAGPECETNVLNDDIALAHYEGRLTDGTVFDSSFARNQPSQFPANRVIRGWTEALGMMCPGDDWLLYLPSDIAYGDNPRPGGPIGPGADLIFRIVLLDEMNMTSSYDSDVWTGAAYN